MKKAALTAAMMLSSVSPMAQTPQLKSNNIDEVIAAMTLDEKIDLVVGAHRQRETPPPAAPGMPDRSKNMGDKNDAFNVKRSQQTVATAFSAGRVPGAAGDVVALERHGITTMVLADGPAGLRIDPTRQGDDKTYYCTAFPVGSTLAASWDVNLTRKVTEAMGNEVREYGCDVLLAPAINIHRNPLCGRNFEYYSEDPLLAGKIASAYIQGIQSNGVGTSLKHFAVNSQETMRNGVNSFVSQRALREIYLKGFEIAVKEAQPWTIMTSYNKVNGVLASENRWLITDVLRKEWGFKGFVMTDWWAEENGARQIEAGNDMLMPGTLHQCHEIKDAVESGRMDVRFLDDCVRRILKVMVQSPTFNRYKYSNTPDLKAHAEVVRQVGAKGMVLLTNNGNLLPLATKQKVALFGVASYDALVGGSGSGYVNRAYKVSLNEGLTQAGVKIDNEIAKAYVEHVKADKAKHKENFWVVPVVPETTITEAEAQAAAKRNDLAILTICRMAGEGGDRTLTKGDWYLTDLEAQNLKVLSEAFHAKGKKLVVLLNMGNIIDMSWADSADAILHTWMPGQEAGHSIADVLTGKVSPSGKLPMTIAKNYEAYSSANDFPSSKGVDGEVDYVEDIFVGYRHFDRKPADIQFPFGFGLSYTTFAYSDLKVTDEGDAVTVKVTVKNTGKRAGKEIVQIYVSAPKEGLVKPVKELRAFAKTETLKPNASETLTMKIAKKDLASYSNYDEAYVLQPGVYTFQAATSSQKTLLSSEIKL